MQEFARVLGLAMLPAAGNFAGTLLAEWLRASPRLVSLALHLAAGIVVSVIAIELMPTALATADPWIPITAFAAGGVAFVGLDRAIPVIQSRFGADGARTTSLAIYFGVSVDLFTDGVLVGTGSVVDLGLALLLALGQVRGRA